MIFSIDPGPAASAFVLYDGERPTWFDKISNELLLDVINEHRWKNGTPHVLVIEQIAAMGMAVGAEVFETVFWSGRFVQAWGSVWDRVKRHEVKMFWCGSMQAKDGNIRQAIIDRYGGKDKAIGRKACQGPLYGVSGDVWQALAVAICWQEREMLKCRGAEVVASAPLNLATYKGGCNV